MHTKTAVLPTPANSAHQRKEEKEDIFNSIFPPLPPADNYFFSFLFLFSFLIFCAQTGWWLVAASAAAAVVVIKGQSRSRLIHQSTCQHVIFPMIHYLFHLPRPLPFLLLRLGWSVGEKNVNDLFDLET